MDPLLVVIISFGLLFVVLASLGNGLSVTTQSIRTPLKGRGQSNIMLLLANFVFMPVLLIGLAALLPFPPQVKMAIIVLAINAGAPFIPWLVSLGKGDLAYSSSAVIMLIVGTVIVLPLAMPLMLNLLGTGATPSTWDVLWPLLLFMVLPLLIGMFIRARYLKLAMEIGPYLGPISITFLVVHIVLFLGYSWADVVSLFGGGVLLFALVFPLAGMLIGYLLSPPYALSPVKPADPQRGTKIVSIVAVAQQNTQAAICCAIFPLGVYTVAGDFILVGAITTIIVVLFTMAELGKRYERHLPAATAPASPVAPAAPTAK
jgi:bile acid:Na+ symporter, BASS family